MSVLKSERIPATEWIKVMKPLIDEGLSLSLVPQGISMFPFIVGGRDSVLLKSAQGVKLKRGDIILFHDKQSDCMLLHRIYRIKNDIIYPLGDSNRYGETPVRPEDVSGIVYEFTRKGKHVSCDNTAYKILVQVWLLLIPLKPIMFWLWLRIRKLIKKY